MIPKLKDIVDVLEKMAPSDHAEKWDNPGLQIGVPSQEITKIFISLDPTNNALTEALNRGANLLLTHHPLIFKPLRHIDGEAFPGNVIFDAVKNGIAILTAHTNLDVAEDGINDLLARLLLLRDVEVLQPTKGCEAGKIGLGRIGYIPNPTTLSQVVKAVKSIFGANGVRTVGNKDRSIKRVAVVGGSGGGMVYAASRKGADLLITGDIGHHEALEALSEGLAVIDSGHFYTEKRALTLFADRFQETLKDLHWKVPVEMYREEENPIHFE